MINIEEQYLGLLGSILYSGKPKQDRTGTGTLSVFGKTIKHNMSLGFPLLTTKKVFFNHALTELIWILRGKTDIAYLHKHKVKYWDDDYRRSGRTDGTLGKVYGYQWRNSNGVDQLASLVRNIRENASSRRLMVNAWNPGDLSDMVLPPCHYNFQVYCRDNQIDLMWQQRSADVFLGLPYDIAMYGLLLEMLAKGANMKAGQLIGNLGDCHLYNNHLKQATIQLERTSKALPQLELDKGIRVESTKWSYKKLFIPKHKHVRIINYNPHPAIKAPLSVGN